MQQLPSNILEWQQSRLHGRSSVGSVQSVASAAVC